MTCLSLACLFFACCAFAHTDEAVPEPARIELDLVLVQVNRQKVPVPVAPARPDVPGAFSILDGKPGQEKVQAWLQSLSEAGAIVRRADLKVIALDRQEVRHLHRGHTQRPADGQLAAATAPYGTVVDFTPTVQVDGKIFMEVEWELNWLDETGLEAPGILPGRTTQRQRIAVTLEDGEILSSGGVISGDMETIAIMAARRLPDLSAAPQAPNAFKNLPAIEKCQRAVPTAADVGGHVHVQLADAESLLETAPKPLQDIDTLKQIIAQAVPTSVVTAISGAGGSVILTGTVSRAKDVDTIMHLADVAGVPAINALRVGGVQQVQLDVVLARVDCKLLRRQYPDQYRTYRSWLGRFPTAKPDDLQEWRAFMQEVRELGMVRLLAEPHMVTLSGRQATFVSGGELAVPAPNNEVFFVPFGTCVNFLPVVDDNQVYLDLEIEVDTHRSRHSLTVECGRTVIAAEGNTIVLVTVHVVDPLAPAKDSESR